MAHNPLSTIDRRVFLSSATLGTGVTLLGQSASSAALVPASQPSVHSLILQEKDRQDAEAQGTSLYVALDRLDETSFLSHFADDVVSEDAVVGDLSVFPGGFSGCEITGMTDFRTLTTAIQEHVGTPGSFVKHLSTVGSAKIGSISELTYLPKTFYGSGFDNLTVNDRIDGKIVRRIDYYDTAQLTPQDVAFLHPGGVPRQSCTPSVEPDGRQHATPDLLRFVSRFNRALSSGSTERIASFFTEDVLLIHPLLRLRRNVGGFGLFNQGNRLRGRRAVEHFLRALLPVLPDGTAEVRHVLGNSTGGGYEWRATGAYAHQGLSRDGILGVTSLSLFGEQIQKISVLFDTLQMTADQRQNVQTILRDSDLDL